MEFRHSGRQWLGHDQTPRTSWPAKVHGALRAPAALRRAPGSAMTFAEGAWLLLFFSPRDVLCDGFSETSSAIGNASTATASDTFVAFRPAKIIHGHAHRFRLTTREEDAVHYGGFPVSGFAMSQNQKRRLFVSGHGYCPSGAAVLAWFSALLRSAPERRARILYHGVQRVQRLRFVHEPGRSARRPTLAGGGSGSRRGLLLRFLGRRALLQFARLLALLAFSLFRQHFAPLNIASGQRLIQRPSCGRSAGPISRPTYP